MSISKQMCTLIQQRQLKIIWLLLVYGRGWRAVAPTTPILSISLVLIRAKFRSHRRRVVPIAPPPPKKKKWLVHFRLDIFFQLQAQEYLYILHGNTFREISMECRKTQTKFILTLKLP